MQHSEQATDAEPTFIPEEYFQGRTRAWGMFTDRFGNVRRQFGVDIHGVIQEGDLVLTEHFTFDDGERSQRIWHIKPLGGHHYEGWADDVPGKAQGVATGNRLSLSYDLNLPIGRHVWRVHLDDIMLLQPDQVLLNRATMSKFGIRLGEIVIFFKKEAELREKQVDQEPLDATDTGHPPALPPASIAAA